MVSSTCETCGDTIPPEPTTGHDVHSDPVLRRKLCWRCYINRPRYRVLMQFFVREAWHVSFLESDCETSLRVHIDAKDAEVIRILAKRGDAEIDEDDGFALNNQIEKGRGTVWLYLLEEQYRKLK